MNTCKHDTFYVTTPIYYVNDVPHIGHAYTTIIADTIARYARLKGLTTHFLTGTDEHGQKIEEAAQVRGFQTKDYADEVSGKFRTLWDDFNISYDTFIRTTDENHKQGVQKAFDTMLEKGDIYKGEYEGHYCVSCETFFTKTQLVDEEFCPDCGKATTLLKEESYFFRLSRYENALKEWYETHENCILPKSRKNEVVRFVEGGLNDLSITRTSFSWGVHLPEHLNDPKHVVYVWLDALLNYVTALGYGNDEKNLSFWPANLHLVGKDILRFHAVYWPAFLMSLDLPLPKHIAAHGWWTRDGAKMSKSKGNVVDPRSVADEFGLENFRYFMLREVPFGGDGDFSRRALADRINNDLANDFGNLLNRILGMSEKYFNFHLSSTDVPTYYNYELTQAQEIIDELEPLLYTLQIHRYLEGIWKLLSLGNKAIEAGAPWAKIKDNKPDEAMAVIAFAANMLYKVSLLLHPIMPETTIKVAQALGCEISTELFWKVISEQALIESSLLTKIPPIFTKFEEEQKVDVPVINKELIIENPIPIDDFFKAQIRIGKIIHAEIVEKSTKLLKLQVDLGECRPRQIVAGIREFYNPESIIGQEVCVVANLKPAKLMGILSEGMILAAKDENGLSFVAPLKSTIVGTPVK